MSCERRHRFDVVVLAVALRLASGVAGAAADTRHRGNLRSSTAAVSDKLLAPRSLPVSGIALRHGSLGVLRVPLRRHEPSWHGAPRMPRSLMQVIRQDSHHASTRGPPVVEIFGNLYVGTPPQNFTVAFDLGSGNVLLPAKKCRSIACLAHCQYDPAMSATSQDIAFVDQPDAPLPTSGARDIVKISVATGHVAGDLMRDKVCLGAEENLCATMGLVEATELSEEPFSLFPYDGILGLGMLGTSVERDFNFIDQLVGTEALLANRFAVWLAMPQDEGEDSEVTFGTASNERIGSPDVLWRPVAGQTGLWQTTMVDVAVDRVKLKLCGTGGCQAAFDTGTGVIAGPTPLIKALLDVLNIQQDCTNYFSLPLLGFAFDGYMLNIEPVDYVKKTEAGCYHQFLEVDVPAPKGPLVLLGIPFLQRYYTIYDYQAMEIGIAFAKHKSSTKEGETNAQAAARLMVRMDKTGDGSAAAASIDPSTPNVAELAAAQSPPTAPGGVQLLHQAKAKSEEQQGDAQVIDESEVRSEQKHKGVQLLVETEAKSDEQNVSLSDWVLQLLGDE